MTQQHDLQRSFGKYLLESQPTTIAHYFKPAIIPAKKALEIHQNNFRLTLIDTLISLFPATKTLIGEECFSAYARQYIERNPPVSPVLSCYGANFPAFLAAQPPLAEILYLKDVGRLEWARNETFHARDAKVLIPDELLEAISDFDNEIKLTLHPSVRLISSPHPISKIWHLASTLDEPAEELNLNNTDHLVVLRPYLRVIILPIDKGTFSLLCFLAQNYTLTNAINMAQETTPDFSPEGSLGNLIAKGAFTSLTNCMEKMTND